MGTHHFVVTMAWTEEYSCKERDPGLIILYKDSAIIHHALGLQGAPVLQGPNPQATGEAFKAYVYNQLVSGVPDKLVNCVEDAISGIFSRSISLSTRRNFPEPHPPDESAFPSYRTVGTGATWSRL